MPSLFPNVDPYLESQGFWPDFHARFITDWADLLGDLLPDVYEARIIERVNPVEVFSRSHRYRREPDIAKTSEPDAAVTQRGGGKPDVAALTAPANATTVEAVTVPLLIVAEERETSIEILHRPKRRLVAVLELLSPANKEELGSGVYRAKRHAVLQQQVHLVEGDLLRGGQRPTLAQPYPPGDYYALVAHADQRPDALVYTWGIRQRLPSIPVPLLGADPAVWVDLAAVYDTTYDRGRYARSINYSLPPTAIADADRAWAAQITHPAPPAAP